MLGNLTEPHAMETYPPATCNFRAYHELQLPFLRAHISSVKSTWPVQSAWRGRLSAVRRQFQDDAPASLEVAVDTMPQHSCRP